MQARWAKLVQFIHAVRSAPYRYAHPWMYMWRCTCTCKCVGTCFIHGETDGKHRNKERFSNWKWSSTLSSGILAHRRRYSPISLSPSHSFLPNRSLAMASNEDPDSRPPPSKKSKRKGKESSWIEEAHFGDKTATSSSGERFTFFFGKESPFSQWHPAHFKVDGVSYNCAEQYMMHQKAVLFGDAAMATEILKSSDPKQQKSLGRKVSNFDPDKWNSECRKLVKAGNVAKFSQDDKLKDALFATEGTTMVEAAPRDTIWGIGLGAKNPKARNRQEWRGKNWLGEILTQVRDELMASGKKSVSTGQDGTSP